MEFNYSAYPGGDLAQKRTTEWVMGRRGEVVERWIRSNVQRRKGRDDDNEH